MTSSRKPRPRQASGGASIGALLHRIEDQLFRERSLVREEKPQRPIEGKLRDGSRIRISEPGA